MRYVFYNSSTSLFRPASVQVLNSLIWLSGIEEWFCFQVLKNPVQSGTKAAIFYPIQKSKQTWAWKPAVEGTEGGGVGGCFSLFFTSPVLPLIGSLSAPPPHPFSSAQGPGAGAIRGQGQNPGPLCLPEVGPVRVAPWAAFCHRVLLCWGIATPGSLTGAPPLLAVCTQLWAAGCPPLLDSPGGGHLASPGLPGALEMPVPETGPAAHPWRAVRSLHYSPRSAPGAPPAQLSLLDPPGTNLVLHPGTYLPTPQATQPSSLAAPLMPLCLLCGYCPP